MNSCLYEGTVRHRRRDAVSDEFTYPLFMAYVDLDELPALGDIGRLFSTRRPALARFCREDYLGDPAQPLADAVRLLTHLRCYGHCFNPVSFYYCFDADGPRAGRVRTVIADVTNTPWRERHSYVIDVADGADRGSAEVLGGRSAKLLHVSPLMGMEHVYDWRLTEPGERLSVHIDAERADGESVFDATLALRRRELNRRSLTRALARYPLQTPRIMARIYSRALRLRLRGAPWFAHPERSQPDRPVASA